MRKDAPGPVSGFTLLQLALTMAITAVLLCLAVPGFQDLQRRQRTAAALHLLATELALARNTAISRGTPVTLCPSLGDGRCRADPDWSAGWLVYRDPTRAAQPRASADIIQDVRGPLHPSVAIQSKVGWVALLGEDGPLTNAAGPETASTVQPSDSAGLVLPAASDEVTENVCPPRPRPEASKGDVHAAATPSRVQVWLATSSARSANTTSASVDCVWAAGPVTRLGAAGATVSITQVTEAGVPAFGTRSNGVTVRVWEPSASPLRVHGLTHGATIRLARPA